MQDSVNLLGDRADSLLSVPGSLFDSLSSKGVKLDKLIAPPADSIQKFNRIPDSLKILHQIDSLRQRLSDLDTLKLQARLDSLRQLRLPLTEYKTKEDSIRQIFNISATARQKLRELEGQLDESINEGQQNLQQRVNGLTENPDSLNQDAVNLLKDQSGLEIPTELPQVESISMEGIDLPITDLPKTDRLESLKNGVPAVNIPEVALPNIEMPEMNKFKTGTLEENLGKVEDYKQGMGKWSSYPEEMSEVGKGKMEKIRK